MAKGRNTAGDRYKHSPQSSEVWYQSHFVSWEKLGRDVREQDALTFHFSLAPKGQRGGGGHMCRIKLFILGIVYNFQFNGHELCLEIITENFLIYEAANCIGIWNVDGEPLSL